MTTFDVTDDASLRAAIFEISNDFADDGVVNGSTGASRPTRSTSITTSRS